MTIRYSGFEDCPGDLMFPRSAMRSPNTNRLRELVRAAILIELEHDVSEDDNGELRFHANGGAYTLYFNNRRVSLVSGAVVIEEKPEALPVYVKPEPKKMERQGGGAVKEVWPRL